MAYEMQRINYGKLAIWIVAAFALWQAFQDPFFDRLLPIVVALMGAALILRLTER